MSESLKAITCPHCGASLEPQDGLDTFFCQYCGGKIMLTGLSDAAYEAKAQIKGMEHQERIKDKEAELEKYKLDTEVAEEKRKNKSLTIFLIADVLLVLLLLSPYMLSSNSSKKQHQKKIAELQQVEIELESAMTAGDYDLALIKANQLYCDGYSNADKKTWDQKRENYIKLIKSKQKEAASPTPSNSAASAEAGESDTQEESEKMLSAPIDSFSYKIYKQNYKDAVLQFEKAGFTNIETEEVADIKTGLLAKEGDVAKITIDGDASYEDTDVFPPDALVRITYHVKED